MSDKDEEQAPRTTLTRQTSSTEYRDFYRVNTDYSLPGDNNLSVVVEDIVMVYKELAPPPGCEHLVYITKRDDTKNCGWINRTYLDQINRIDRFARKGAVFSNPPLGVEFPIPRIRTNTSSMSSISSSSSFGSASSTKRGIGSLTIGNSNTSVASSDTRDTPENVRRVMKKKKATANETGNETANETANNKPARVIWFLFSNDGNKNFWSRNSDAKPVLISCEGYEEPKNDGDGNFQLCLTNLSKAHYSWNDVLKALNVYMNQTMRLCVNHNIAYPGQVLNGMNNFETIEKKSPLVLNKKVYGYLYKANSTEEFGILMKTNHHISEHAHANSFGKEFNYDGKVFCLYNSIADEFGFLAYQYNCEWMKIRSGSRFTGLCAYLLKEGIEKDKE